MTPPIWQVARRIEKAEDKPPAEASAPGEWEGGLIILPEKESPDGRRFGQVVVGETSFMFTSQQAGAEIGRAVRLAGKGEGGALAALEVLAVERGGLPAALRLCWRKAGAEVAEALAALLSPRREEIMAQVVTERRAARKQRKRVRPGLPVLVAEVVDVPALPDGRPERLLLPAACEGERNSVAGSHSPPLPEGWHEVGGPRPQPRPWLDRSAGRPINVRFPGYPATGWED